MADKIFLEDDFYRVYKNRLDTYVKAITYNGQEESRLSGNFSSLRSQLSRYLVQTHACRGFTEVMADEMYDWYAGGELKIFKNHSYINPVRYPELGRLHKLAEDARFEYNSFIWFRVHNYIDRIIEIQVALKYNKLPSNIVDDARKFVAFEYRLQEIRDNGLWEYSESGKRYYEETERLEKRYEEDFARKHPGYRQAKQEAWEDYQRASRHGRVSAKVLTDVDEEYGFKRYEPERLTITRLANVYYDYIDYREKSIYEKQKSLNNLENYCRGVDKALREIYPNKTPAERISFWDRHFKLPLTIYPDKKAKPVAVEKPKTATKPKESVVAKAPPKVEKPSLDAKKEVKVEKPQPKEEPAPYQWQPPKELQSDFRSEKGVLKRYVGRGDCVVVPDGITRMWYSAFDKAKDFLKEVVLPEGITEIADDTFENCALLERIELPSTLTKIGARAFCGCKKLHSITMPKKLQRVSIRAFEDCEQLKSITLPKDCDYEAQPSPVASFPKSCIVKGGTVEQKAVEEKKPLPTTQKPVAKQVEKVAKIEVKPTTTVTASDFSIENNVCKGYLGQAEVVIVPNGVKKIGGQAFAKNLSIKRVILPEGVREIASFAFDGCENLESVELPSTLKIMKNGVFCGCKKLNDVALPANLKQLGGYAFNVCESIERISIPASLEKILSFTFVNCKKLKEVSFTPNIKEIEYGAFDGCGELKSVAIPKSCVLGRFIILGAFPEGCQIVELKD